MSRPDAPTLLPRTVGTKSINVDYDDAFETASLITEGDAATNSDLSKRTETKILELFWTTVQDLKKQNEELQKKSDRLERKSKEQEHQHKQVQQNLSKNDHMLSYLMEEKKNRQAGGTTIKQQRSRGLTPQQEEAEEDDLSWSEKNDLRKLVQEQQIRIAEQQEKIEQQQKQIEEQQMKMELIQENIVHKSDVENHVLETMRSTRETFYNEAAEPARLSTLPEDTFSFMMCSRVKSIPFWLAVGIFGMQIVTFSLLADDLIGPGDNPLNIPANVEAHVRVTQVIAILVSIVIQDDLRDSIGQLSEIRAIDNVMNVFQDSTVTKWWLSCVCRFLEGVLGLFVTFCLIVTADNVFDILVNFTAMGFVANLDNLAFILSLKGIFGVSSLTKAEEIKHGMYQCCNKRPIVSQVLLCLTSISMIVGWLTVVRDQTHSRYLCKTVHVDLADNIIIDLGGYSGFYHLDDSLKMDGRVRYIQRLPRNNKGGTFAYCDQEPAWVFSSVEQDDPCQSWQAKSTDTVTFDFLDTLDAPWVAKESNSDFEVQLDYIRLTCFDDYLSSRNSNYTSESSSIADDEMCTDGQYGIHCNRKDPCKKIRINNLTRDDEQSFFMATEYELLEMKKSDQRSVQSYSHPVYVATPSGGGGGGGNGGGGGGGGGERQQDGNDDSSRRQDDKSSDDDDDKSNDQGRPGGKNNNDRGRQNNNGNNNNNSNERQRDTNNNNDNNNLDLVFYCGRRWVLTHTGAIKNLTITSTNSGGQSSNQAELLDAISDYFLKGFHITDFEEKAVVYISEVTLPSETPVGLRWYNAIYSDDPLEFSILPEPDLDNIRDFSFHCGYCKNEGILLSDRTCKCMHRASGDRCETEPSGDGICDLYFNKERHDYDGGDCCAATCGGNNGTEYCASSQELTSTFPSKAASTGGNLFAKENQVGYHRCRDPSLGRISIQMNHTNYNTGGPRPKYHIQLECGTTMILNTTENIGSAFTISYIHIKESTECKITINPLGNNNNQGYVYAIYPESSGDTVKSIKNATGQDAEEIDVYLMKQCLLTNTIGIGAALASDINDPSGKASRWVDQNSECGDGSSVVQRYALAVLYHAMDIESITNDVTWLDVPDECSWGPGITCNSDNVVTQIKLEEKGLQGYIPTEIGLLSGLESIMLRNNLLTGTIPSELATIPTLQWLDLSSNQLTGVVPAELDGVGYRNFMNNELT